MKGDAEKLNISKDGTVWIRFNFPITERHYLCIDFGEHELFYRKIEGKRILHSDDRNHVAFHLYYTNKGDYWIVDNVKAINGKLVCNDISYQYDIPNNYPRLEPTPRDKWDNKEYEYNTLKRKFVNIKNIIIDTNTRLDSVSAFKRHAERISSLTAKLQQTLNEMESMTNKYGINKEGK